MAKGRSGRPWQRVRRMAYNRDAARNAPCWICGKPIDYQASNDAKSADYSPDAWEPDHFYSPEERPELAEDLANLRPSHSRCNRQRGAEQKNAFSEARNLGKTSRAW